MRSGKLRHSVIFSIIVLLMAVLKADASPKNDVVVSTLTVEGRSDLLGSDILNPRFSWKLEAGSRNVFQTAYQVMVSSSKEKLAKDEFDIWNSGKVISGSSLNILYEGKMLRSFQSYYWKVKVWTNRNNSKTSNISFWTVGLLQPSDWKAKWIGLNGYNKYDTPDSTFTKLAARYIRNEFISTKKIVDATAYISGMGLYELYLNGRKVGLDVLAPTVSEYNKTVYYNTYNISNYLKQGKNAIGVILGNGRYFGMRNYHGEPNPLTGISQTHYGLPRLLLQIRLVYSDGEVAWVSSDQNWRVTDDGPLKANNEFDGEYYDANQELAGWNEVGYNDKGWRTAALMPIENVQLKAQPNENIRIKQMLSPITIHATSRGSYILDMGQNMVGWLAIKLKSQKGDTLRMRFAETMKGKDSIYLDNMRDAQVTDTYIFKSNEEEQWEPKFTYHGFRFVEITGLKQAPNKSDFLGKVLYDDIATIGTFETSNETINAVFKNSYWTIRGNYRGMPTDCPQRDERVGWLGDRVISSYGESFIFDNSRLYAKWLDDIEDAQLENGSLPDIAPTFWKRYADDVTYPSAFIFIPEMLRKQFGDYGVIEKHYPAMKKWMLYMWETYQEDSLILKDAYGDWCVPPESLDMIWTKDSSRITNGGLLASAYYYKCLKLMKTYAESLNKKDDMVYFENIAQQLLIAFNKKYFNEKKSFYANNTVTANLLPLSFGMVTPKYRSDVFDNVKLKLKAFNNHINSGIIGGMWLMRCLSDNGASDIAYTLATNKTYPSWGYMIEKGATTIWELWNGDAANPMMNSGNHQMLLGDLIIWYYEYLAGIKSDETEVAFKKIIMNPVFPKGLNFVKASLNTKYGWVKSEWSIKDDILNWNITIPANTTAEIVLPASAADIRESGRKLPNNIVLHKKSNGAKETRVAVGSGKYAFSIVKK